jgi:hypothetical protein
MLVSANPRRTLAEFYPPPYNTLAPKVLRRRPRGMGQSAAQDINLGASAVGSTAGILAATGVIGATTGALTAGIGAAAALLAGVLIKTFSGCGQSCVLTSDAANQIGDALSQNVQMYLAEPVHYKSVQQGYLANFDNTWAKLVEYCGSPSFGKAGKNCVDDRKQGACKWKASPGGWSQDSSGKWSYHGAGPAGSGDSCWNYFVGFRDPIANDPTVVPDPSPVTPSVSSLVSAITPGAGTVSVGGVDLSGFLLPAALIGGGLLLLAGGR